MKVILPGHGLYGQRSVDLRIPTFKDLKEIQTYSKDEVPTKIKFVQMLSDVDIEKVTWYDIEFLFSISAFSLLYNSITYNVKCPKCQSLIKTNLQITELDIKELDTRKNNLEKKSSYTYHVLTAKQMLDAYEIAQIQPDEEQAFEDLQATMTLGLPKDQFKEIRGNLPLRVYLSTFLYQRLKYHGLSYLATARCSCGETFKYKYKITTDILKLDITELLEKYYDVSGYLSIEGFWDMTFIDYNALVNVINKRLK